MSRALGRHLGISFDFGRYHDTGGRVFVTNGEVFPLGIETDVKVVPLAVTAAYRFPRPRRALTPFIGGGINWHRYTETSTFAASGEDVSATFTGFHAAGGAGWRLSRLVSIAGVGRWLSVPDAFGFGHQRGHTDDNLAASRRRFGSSSAGSSQRRACAFARRVLLRSGESPRLVATTATSRNGQARRGRPGPWAQSSGGAPTHTPPATASSPPGAPWEGLGAVASPSSVPACRPKAWTSPGRASAGLPRCAGMGNPASNRALTPSKVTADTTT
jgi:hypothetical protein